MKQAICAIAFALASTVVASAQEPRMNRPEASGRACGPCSVRVAPPVGSVEYKIRTFTPSPDVDYKGRVLCMCPEGEPLIATTSPGFPPALRQYDRNVFVRPRSASRQFVPHKTGLIFGAPAPRPVWPAPFVKPE